MNDTSAADAVASTLPRHAWADSAGMIASIGCAIHCAAMPLLLVYLPYLGLDWLAGEGFHRWMAVVCFVLAAAAFGPGWRKHRSLVPAMWGAAGLLLLTTTAFGMEARCCATCPTEGVDLSATSSCGHATCSLCRSGREHSAVAPESGDSFALLATLMTPLGGLLLVGGHLSNHRRTCRCQKHKCAAESVDCPSDPTSCNCE